MKRDPITRVKIIAILAVLAVGAIAYLYFDNRIAGTEKDIASDACQKGREVSLRCRAQTCRRLEAVGGHARLCREIGRKVGRAPNGTINLPPVGGASPPQPSGGGGGGSTPGPQGEPGPAGTPGASGGSGGSESPARPRPPIDIQLPNLPVNPSVCVGGVAALNC